MGFISPFRSRDLLHPAHRNNTLRVCAVRFAVNMVQVKERGCGRSYKPPAPQPALELGLLLSKQNGAFPRLAWDEGVQLLPV